MAPAKKGIEEHRFIFTEAINESDFLSAANCYKIDA